MLFASDPPGPVSSVITSHPLDKLCGECEIVVSDFLDAKRDPIMHQPAIALQTISLLTSVPQVYIHVRKLTHPHHAWGDIPIKVHTFGCTAQMIHKYTIW